MRQLVILGATLVCWIFLPIAGADAADLVLKRVMLSTGGVGYFEYEAEVGDDATLTLNVPLDQVDDVLKSLAVYDAAGTVAEMTLPGRELLTQSFADLPFDRAALNSEVDLLNALQGAEIRVSAPKAITGRLVHVDQESVAGPNGTSEMLSRVSVMTDQGLRQFTLHDVDAIAFADAKLQEQVDTALQRIAAYRSADRRQLTIRVHGAGTRTLRVGYVAAMPLWKASYRLSLSSDPTAISARLQGWAVLENFSGQPWQDVELTLLSGNPVTFRQALYESYFVPRPTVPVESGTHVLPSPDTGTMMAETASKASPSAPRQFAQRAAPGGAPMAVPAPPPAQIEAAAAEEQTTQIAFTLPERVNVAAGQSLVVPLLDRELPLRRVDLYQPSADPRHPLAAIELTNSSGTGLPPGVLTLYQQDSGHGAVYLGDARLSSLPAGEKRLLSYAVDNKTSIDRSTEERHPVAKATIAQGVMRLNRMIRWTTRYRIKTAEQAPATLLVEQPRRPGTTLTMPDSKGIELTANAYRIPLVLSATGEGVLAVVEEQPVEETVKLLDIDDNRLGLLVSSSELDAKVQQALAAIADRRLAIARQKTEVERLNAERAQLVDDEKRLRDNLGALGSDPEMHKRLLAKFDETETAIDTDTAGIAKSSDALTATQHDLTAYIAGLTL